MTDTHGAQPTNTPDPVTFKVEGPVPPIAARSKPENSLMSRGSPASSQFDGPFGGKKPQS